MVDLPEENELVIAIIKKIQPYGAFCVLPEYNNLEAFLHISEVAARWIKNIHEFISEGQQHVVKVYRLDREKNQVDLSLKRVNEEEKRRKLESIQTEKKAVKLLQLALKDAKSDLKPEIVRPKLEEKFGDLYEVFVRCAESEDALNDVDIPAALKSAIMELSKRSVKKQVVKINGIAMLKCYGENGVENIKKAFEIKNDNLSILYLGAPRYQLVLTADNYKDGEKTLNSILEKVRAFAQKNSCEFSFENAE